MRIRVLPESLRDLAAQCQRAAQELNDLQTFLGRAWIELDWEVRQSQDLEQRVAQARRQALALAEEVGLLARFLLDRAAAFEEADQEGAILVAGNASRWSAFRVVSPAAFSLSSRLRQEQVLGSWISSLSIPPILRLEPQTQEALVNLAVEKTLERIGLGFVNDLLDAARLPAWIPEVNRAFQAWEQAAVASGRASPETQQAYGRLWETLIFQMPVLGDEARLGFALLKALGELNPVE